MIRIDRITLYSPIKKENISSNHFGSSLLDSILYKTINLFNKGFNLIIKEKNN